MRPTMPMTPGQWTRAGSVFLAAIVSLAGAATAQGQTVNAQLRAYNGVTAPFQTYAPTAPAGGAQLTPNHIWFCDRNTTPVFLRLDPVDPANPSGLLAPNNELRNSGAWTTGFPCGQVAFDNKMASALGGKYAFVTQSGGGNKGGRGSLYLGVDRLEVSEPGEQILSSFRLAPNAGLEGDRPTALAIGPDGNLYIGFEKNGNIKRIIDPSALLVNHVVQSVGKSSSRATRAIAFVGNDLYLATADGFSVIKHAASPVCQGGCNATPITDGFAGISHVGLVSNGVDTLYLTINNGEVWRYRPSTDTRTLIATGGLDPSGNVLAFSFVGGNTNMLFLDQSGNLWIGDDPSDGNLNFNGRIWTISATDLSNIP